MSLSRIFQIIALLTVLLTTSAPVLVRAQEAALIATPQAVIGTNTVACIQSGIFWGYVGLVREICARIKAERGRDMTVVATGGLAPLFQQNVDLFDRLEEDLTMHGLTVIHRHNRENATS